MTLDKNGAVHTQKSGLIATLSPQLPLPDRVILWWEKRQNKYLVLLPCSFPAVIKSHSLGLMECSELYYSQYFLCWVSLEQLSCLQG